VPVRRFNDEAILRRHALEDWISGSRSRRAWF